MKKMNDPGGPVMKPLAELTLLDRFYLHVLWRTAGPWNWSFPSYLAKRFVWRGSLRQRGKCGPCPGCVPSGWMCILWMRRTVFTMRKYRKRIPVI